MSFNFSLPAKDGRGRCRDKGQPPRSGKYRGGAPLKSAQGVFPIIPDDDTAFAFMEFIHSRGSTIHLTSQHGSRSPACLRLAHGRRKEPHCDYWHDGMHFPSGCSSGCSGESQAYFPGIHHQIPQRPPILQRRRSDGDPYA